MFKLLMLAFALMGGPTNSVNDDEPYIVVYNIADLEQSTHKFKNVPRMDLEQIQANSPKIPNEYPRNDPQAIVNIIKDFIEPETWGRESSIRYFDGNIIVKAPKRIHEQIQ